MWIQSLCRVDSKAGRSVHVPRIDLVLLSCAGPFLAADVPYVACCFIAMTKTARPRKSYSGFGVQQIWHATRGSGWRGFYVEN